ncbi:hypothetical protein niasHS_013805 [Heterodera schachtii]|uniref:Uncharacterized protein n=1 Tax=Heterodera schachtii TaxID=97005 RepID=A0ABD2J3A8_HETSC
MKFIISIIFLHFLVNQTFATGCLPKFKSKVNNSESVKQKPTLNTEFMKINNRNAAKLWDELSASKTVQDLKSPTLAHFMSATASQTLEAHNRKKKKENHKLNLSEFKQPQLYVATSTSSSSKNGTSKNGKSKSGTSKNGTSKDGTSKNGKSKSGTSKNGTSKDGTSKKGKSKSGTSKNGTSKDGTSKNGKSKITSDSSSADLSDQPTAGPIHKSPSKSISIEASKSFNRSKSSTAANKAKVKGANRSKTGKINSSQSIYKNTRFLHF